MTYQKIGQEFWDECAHAGLSDAAVRTHAEALGWLYRVESKDLRVPKHLLHRFAGSTEWETAVKDLVAAGFWRDHGDNWVVVHHATVYRGSLGAQRKKRERDRRAQAAHRKRQSGADVSAYPVSQSDRSTQLGEATSSAADDAWLNGGRTSQ